MVLPPATASKLRASYGFWRRPPHVRCERWRATRLAQEMGRHRLPFVLRAAEICICGRDQTPVMLRALMQIFGAQRTEYVPLCCTDPSAREAWAVVAPRLTATDSSLLLVGVANSAGPLR